MTQDIKDVLKLALEFIENSECGTADLEALIKEALREHAMREVQRLGQEIEQEPEQEPRNVRERWNVELDGNDLLVCFNDHEKGDKCQYERYSPQRTFVGLTDEEYTHITDSVYHQGHGLVAYYKAIEAKLKERNT